MKLYEFLAEAFTARAGAEHASLDDIKIEPQDGGKFKVTVIPTAGPLVNLMRDLAYNLEKKKGYKVLMKSGSTLPHWSKFKANGLLITPPSKDALIDFLKVQIKAHNNSIDKETRYKNAAPQRKKENQEYQSKQAKERKAKLEAEFGKGTWDRVKIRQVGGDDGYQWTLFVDGVERYNGMMKYEAEARQRNAADEIAKKEKLGKYAKKDPK